LEYCQEGGLVANVGDILLVEVIKPSDKVGRPTEKGDESGHVVGYEAGMTLLVYGHQER
jgi:hypothetical protein